MAAQTEEFIVALKETDKVAFIETLIDNKGVSKVDKIVGKGLSQEDFTTALKTKLASMEGSHFKGVHATLADLKTAHPTAEAGSYAYIKAAGHDEIMAIWALNDWQEMGASGGMTGGQIAALLFAEPDTNNFDDVAKAKLASLGSAMKFNVATVADIPNVPYTEGDMGQIRNYNGTNKEAIALYNDNSNWVFFEQDRLASLGLNIVGNNLVSDNEIELKNTQVLSSDPVVTAADNRLITVANAFAIELSLKQFVDQHFMPLLDPDNPTLKMKVSDTGLAAQMQVVHDGHNRATMNWLKSTGEFAFSLSGANGAQQAAFEIKPDGHAYIGTKQVATIDDVAGGAGGLFQYDYKIKTDAADQTPSVKFISFDNVDFTKTTKLYINKKDRNNADMSLFLKAIGKGDYFNIHDNNNVNQFVAFDVTGAAVQNGDVFEVPVSHFDDNGTLTNGERVYIHWKQPAGDTSKLMDVKDTPIHDIDDITETGIYYGQDVTNSPVTGAIMVMASKDPTGNFGYFLMGTNRILHTGGRMSGGTAVDWNSFLSSQGVITDIHDIKKMGIYEGTDVANSPVQGHIIVEAYQDSSGDLDLSMKDQTGRRTEGGMPAGGVATWHHVAADHLFGTGNPHDTLGHDGDLYFKTS